MPPRRQFFRQWGGMARPGDPVQACEGVVVIENDANLSVVRLPGRGVAYLGFVVCLAVTLCSVGSFGSDDATGTDRLELRGADAVVDEEAEKAFEKKSFWFLVTTNYHLRLEESENQVDQMLNNTLGKLLPRWERPRTFKNWCEEMRVWDTSAGYGRDINAKSSWSVYGGGGYGTVQNSDGYFPLGVPMHLSVDFTRLSLFVGSSVSYYPWGRPEKLGKGWRKSLAGTRPVGEMNIGYNHQMSVGDVKVYVAPFGRVAHIEQKDQYHLLWASPRLGFETPLTENYSLNVLGGYVVFLEHGPEFNGFLLEFLLRRRF